MHFLERRWDIITKNKIYFIQISIEIQLHNSRYQDVETLHSFIDPNKTTIDELFDISKTMWKRLKDHMEEAYDGELRSECAWGEGDCSFECTDFAGDRDFVLCTNPLTTISILENGNNNTLYSTKSNNTNPLLGDIITSFPLVHGSDLYYVDKKKCYRDDFDLFSDYYDEDDLITTTSPDNSLFVTLDNYGKLSFYDETHVALFSDKISELVSPSGMNVTKFIKYMEFNKTKYVLDFYIDKDEAKSKNEGEHANFKDDIRTLFYNRISYSLEKKELIRDIK